MTPAEASALWESVKANAASLNACKGPHTFRPASPDRKLGGRFVCALCGGEVSATDRIWYERGLADARKGTT